MRHDAFGKHLEPWEKPEELELEYEREIATQTEVLTCRLTTFEDMRRLSRQQFRSLLRDKLQAFGDEILATWEKMYGGETDGG